MYKEIKANMWDEQFKDDIKIITTNKNINNIGKAVMGKGIALEAAQRFKFLRGIVACHIMSNGNTCCYVPQYKIITFPTKNNFWESSDLNLIRQSMIGLYEICKKEHISKVIFPHVGCQNGGLDWENVKSNIEDILQINEIEFIIINL